jgi:hypothetical protein
VESASFIFSVHQAPSCWVVVGFLCPFPFTLLIVDVSAMAFSGLASQGDWRHPLLSCFAFCAWRWRYLDNEGAADTNAI